MINSPVLGVRTTIRHFRVSVRRFVDDLVAYLANRVHPTIVQLGKHT